MFGSFIGKVLSAPLKIVNIPLRVADKALNYALDEPDRPRLAAPLKETSEVIEDAAKDICDDD